MRGRPTRWTVLADALGSWRLWVGVAAVVTVTPLLSLLPVDRSLLATLLSGVTGAGALLAAVWAGWLLVLRHLQGGARLAAAVPLVLLAALTRGCVVIVMLQVPDRQYWLVSSCLTVTIATLTGLLAKVGIDGHRMRLEYLSAEQKRLSAVLASADAEVRWRRQDAMAEVIAELTEQFADVPETAPALTMESLERLSAEVVRPLSHELASLIPAWKPPPPPVVGQRLDWTRVWGSVADVKLLDPWGPAAIVLVSTASSIFAMDPLVAVLMHMLVAAAVLVGIWLVRRLDSTMIRGRSTPVRLAAAYGLLVAACVPAGVIAAAFPGPASDVAKALWLVLVLPLAALLLSVVRAARVQQRELEQQAVDTARQTQWWISRTRMVSWWQRAVLARALHGPVQSTIHAAVHRLRAADTEGSATPELVRQTLAEVTKALPDAVLQDPDAGDVAARLTSLTAMWRLVADVSCDVSSETLLRLQQDPVCADIAVDALREATSNAIRHGGARTVRATLRMPGQDTLRVEVSDDGRGRVDVGGRAGLGTAMLDACTLGWGYDDDLRRLWLELPWIAQDDHARTPDDGHPGTAHNPPIDTKSS